MTRVLLVANRSLGSPQISDFVRERLVEQGAEFTLLVPARAGSDGPASRLAGGLSSVLEGVAGESRGAEDKYAQAHARLEYGLELMRQLGATADGEVGDSDAGRAIDDVLSRKTFDEVALSTLPEGIGRWLKLDIPSRVERKFHVPVTVIQAQEG